MKKHWKQKLALLMALTICISGMPMNGLIDVQAAKKSAKVKSIKLNKTQYVLKKGEKVKLKATINPKSAKGVKITWKSSKPKVVSVTKKGVAKAKAKKGSAVITAKAGKKKATCKITIGTPVKKISASNMTIKVGEKKKITTTLTPKRATIKTLTYSSNNEKTAKVDKKGRVTGVKAGKATITITAKDRMEVKKKIQVTVMQKPVSSTTTKNNTTTKKEESTTKHQEDTSKDDSTNNTDNSSSSSEESTSRDDSTNNTDNSSSSSEESTSKDDSTNNTENSSSSSTENTSSSEQESTSKEEETTEPEQPIDEAKAARFELSWEDREKDLDLEVCGPNIGTNNGGEPEFSLSRKSDQDKITVYDKEHKKQTLAVYKGDSIDGTKPEEVVLGNVESGIYKIYVKDYTVGNQSSTLASAKPVVKIYEGEELKETIEPVSTDGTHGEWFVCMYDYATKQIVPINEISSRKTQITELKSEIATWFNKLLDYEVEDAEKFAQQQKTLDDIRTSYGSETSSLKLEYYRDSMKKIYNQISKDMKLLQVSDEKGELGNIKTEEGEGSISYYYYDNRTYILYLNNKSISGDIKVTWQSGKSASATKLNDNLYIIKMINDTLGVSKFYFLKIDITDEWVYSVNQDNNIEYCDVDETKHEIYVGGSQAKLDENLDISKDVKTGYHIVCESIEYQETAQNWQYNKDYTAVLHLKNTYTEEKRDYGIYWIQNPPYLMNVTAKDNTITYISRSEGEDSWNKKTIEWTVIGTNAQMGKLTPKVGKDMTATVEYDVTINNKKADAKITVANQSGKTQEYLIYYYQDIEPVDITGIYDPNNFYWIYRYDSKSPQKKGEEIYYEIRIEGRNSSLGKSFQVNTWKENTIKTEYEDKDGTWSVKDADAKIVITSPENMAATFYVSYSKARYYYPVKSISLKNSDSGKKIVSCHGGDEDSDISIITDEEVTKDELQVELDEGYEFAPEDPDHHMIISTGGDTHYAYYYIQEDNRMTELRRVYSASDEDDAITNMERVYDDLPEGENGEKYEGYTVIGIPQEIPKDLKAEVSWGAEYSITYADADAAIPEGFVAKVTVTGKNNKKKMYLLKYKQDNSMAVITSISDANNSYIGTDINPNENTIWLDDEYTKSETAAVICVLGQQQNLGKTFQCTPGEGCEIVKTIYKGDKEWIYGDAKSSEYCVGNKEYTYIFEAAVIVRTENGAQKTYLIGYAQDDSGAVITDIKNQSESSLYVKSIRRDVAWYENNEESKREEVYEILVEGTKENFQSYSYGTDYTFEFAEGAVPIGDIIYKGDENWIYENCYIYVDDENYPCQACIKVQAANGAVRTQLIAYKENAAAVAPKGISEEGNTITGFALTTYTIWSMEGTEETWNVIGVRGYNESLGAYELQLPDGAKAEKISSAKDDDWAYGNVDVEVKFSEDEDTYERLKAAEIIQITNENTGQKRNYMVAYVQDDADMRPLGVKNGENMFTGFGVSDEKEQILVSISNEGERIWDNQYVIYLRGTNKTLGNYELELTDGVEIKNRIISTDAGWKYHEDAHVTGTFEQEDRYEYVELCPVEQITLYNAETKQERIYVVAYAQDDSALKIQSIEDGDNIIASYVSSAKDTIYYDEADEEGGGTQQKKEEMYAIYVYGKKSSLSADYKLILPDGTEAKIAEEDRIKAGSAEWKYGNQTEQQWFDVEGAIIGISVDAVEKITIRDAEKDLEVSYMIYYGQDDSAIKVQSIQDGENIIASSVSSEKRTIYYWETNEGETQQKEEEMYAIYVYGKKSSLSADYKLILPDGTEAKIAEEDRIKAGSAEWKYGNQTEQQWFDVEGASIGISVDAVEKITIRDAEKDLEVSYMIYYGQDDRSVKVQSIEDGGNIIASNVSSAKDTIYYDEADEEGGTQQKEEEMYAIYVYGNQASLSDGYKLILSDGTEAKIAEEDRIKADSAEWKYGNQTALQWFDVEGASIGISVDAVEKITIRDAEKGLEASYMIYYAQDDRSVKVQSIEDKENIIASSVSFEKHTIYYNETNEEETQQKEEEMYAIYVYGNQASLSENYKLILSDGTEAEIAEGGRIKADSAEWKYGNQTELQWFDVEGASIGIFVDAVEKITIRDAEKGLEASYMIYYAQDDRDTEITSINSGNAQISFQTERTELPFETTNEEGTVTELEKVHMVLTDSQVAKDTLQLTFKNSEIQWEKQDANYITSYYMDTKIQRCYVIDYKVVVTAPNGTKRTYVMAHYYGEQPPSVEVNPAE